MLSRSFLTSVLPISHLQIYTRHFCSSTSLLQGGMSCHDLPSMIKLRAMLYLPVRCQGRFTITQHCTRWGLRAVFVQDKVNISVAIIPMAEDFGWSSTVSGLVQSSFFFGYMLTQIPGGYIISKKGGRTVLPFGVGLWSLATAAVPVMASTMPGRFPFGSTCRGCMHVT